MMAINRRTTLIKLGIVGLFGLLAIAVFITNDRQRATAASSGPSPSHTNAPGEDNCTACHTSFPVNTGGGSVQIVGLPQNYLPGQQIAVTVTTSLTGAVVYGFQLTAIDQAGKTVGTFALPSQNPAQMQFMTNIVGGKNRRYVEHTTDGIIPTQFGSKSWTFTWTAPNPAAGKVDFYAAGNAADGDGTNSGDYIYTTTVSTSPGSSSLVTVGGQVFNSDGIQGLRNTTVALTDPNGVIRTTTTSSFGFYSFGNVASGPTYTLTVRSRLYRFAPKNLAVMTDLSNVNFIGLE